MTPHQSVIHGIENRLYGIFRVTVSELGKTIGQLFDKVRARHQVKVKRQTKRSEKPELNPPSTGI